MYRKFIITTAIILFNLLVTKGHKEIVQDVTRVWSIILH